MSPISGPVFESDEAYAASLRDVKFWKPLVQLALEHAQLAVGKDVVLPEVGTYPTFLVDEKIVVKLYGERYCGPESHRAESSAYAELKGVGLPIPEVIHAGELFLGEAKWPWPFLVFKRIEGAQYGMTAERLGHAQRARCARDVGAFLARLHTVPVRSPDRWDDFGAFLRARRLTARADHARWAHLPAHLVDEIDDWLPSVPDLLASAGGGVALVHGDLHEDHVFIEPETGALTGVIDFTDAWHGDPRYDFVALQAGTFHFDRRLLNECLEGYGWVRSQRFAQEMLAFTLLHEFDMFADTKHRAMGFGEVRDLDDLARLLWDVDQI